MWRFNSRKINQNGEMPLVKRGTSQAVAVPPLPVNKGRGLQVRGSTCAGMSNLNPPYPSPATGGSDPRSVYAAFFSPDNAPRIFFIHADKRWRFCSRRTTDSLVTQLN